MNNLLGSLGLDSVAGDPNEIPDGRYDGEVSKSEFVVFPNKDSFNHVITYKVTDGSFSGATRQEVYTLGTSPVDKDGNSTRNASEVVSFTPSMSDSAKTWYKKRYLDLGVPESKINETNPEDLVGIPVTFGVKRNGQWVNVNFVEKREGGSPVAAPVNSGSISDML